ncbi:hypothetical protein AB0O76_14380 [Streptomyces sp. NPDC086554]|uniref:hypothetical protein n=1 Tax=Streptomyces sp. NPDC086554 TaxID=3154864 RepID=UPI0034277A3D
MNDSQQDAGAERTLLRRWRPAAAMTGFAALLVVIFAVAYATGSAVGPVAPGLHPGQEQSAGTGDKDSGGGGDDGPDDDMEGDMNMGEGH